MSIATMEGLTVPTIKELNSYERVYTTMRPLSLEKAGHKFYVEIAPHSVTVRKTEGHKVLHADLTSFSQEEVSAHISDLISLMTDKLITA